MPGEPENPTRTSGAFAEEEEEKSKRSCFSGKARKDAEWSFRRRADVATTMHRFFPSPDLMGSGEEKRR